MRKRVSALVAAVLAVMFAPVIVSLSLLVRLPDAHASGDLDHIRNYWITVFPNEEDATLTIYYNFDWEVMDSSSEGPLSWVKIGIPNKHCLDYGADTDNIKDLEVTTSGGTNMKVTFDRDYYEGEIVSFTFHITQDYMYEVNRLTDGETVYDFTPGWFDDILVDEFDLYWYADKAESWSPSCEMFEDYLHWNTSLSKGEKFPVQITYKNDAFHFDESKKFEDSKGSMTYAERVGDFIGTLIGVLVTFAIPIGVIGKIVSLISSYTKGAGFGSGSEKKVTRTLIEYYPACPGCGAARPEGKDNCEYCGRSLIKKKEKIEEKDIPKEEKEIRGKTTNGTYRYSSSPNTYVRVNVVNVPVVHHSSWSSGSSSRGSSSHHSSCAHSSCACACACACAGGGRAGCTTKDFYNTNLKLAAIRKKCRPL